MPTPLDVTLKYGSKYAEDLEEFGTCALQTRKFCQSLFSSVWYPLKSDTKLPFLGFWRGISYHAKRGFHLAPAFEKGFRTWHR